MKILGIILIVIVLWLTIGCVGLYFATHHFGGQNKLTEEQEQQIKEYMRQMEENKKHII